MNPKDYARRVKKARASRDLNEGIYPESFYIARISAMQRLIDKLTSERNSATLKRDEALKALGRIKIAEMTKEKT